MSSSVKMLEAQRQEAKTQARLVNGKLRAQRNLIKCRKGREEAKSNRLRKVGFRILALAQDAQKTLDRWLSVKLPELQADDRYKLMEEIVDEFISLDIDNILGMLEPIARSDTRLLEEAKAAISSCDLHSWVCQQNIQKGLAPTVGAMVRKRQRLSEQAGGPLPTSQSQGKVGGDLTSGSADGERSWVCPRVRSRTETRRHPPR